MSWNGVKKQSNIENIKAWCDEMKIKNYIINSQGEIDVDGNVDLEGIDITELPYKFRRVIGYFSVRCCENLTSLKNCPTYIGRSFNCSYCSQLDSLEGCPKEVGGHFFCGRCKREFIEGGVRSLCKVKGIIIN